MNSAIELAPIPKVRLTATAAAFEAGLDYRGWLAAGRQLGRMAGASNFWIGDWVVHAAQKAEGRSDNADGESWSKYEHALEVTGLEYDHLRNVAWVSRNVPLSSRDDRLTWAHHREVAALTPKEQRKWLEKAAAGENGTRWTVSQLRQAIRAERGQLAGENEPDPGLMKWARPAEDLTRYLKAEDAAQPIEKWPVEKKEALRLALKDAKEIIDRIWRDG